MSSMTFTTYGTRRSSRWSQLRQQLAEWHRRSFSRYELQNLSDRSLRDIGLTHCEVHRETTKPFWMV